MRHGVRTSKHGPTATPPQTPEEHVDYAKQVKDVSDKVWCPYCETIVPDALGAHVRNTHELTGKEIQADFPGIPMSSEAHKERISEGLKEEFGAFDWDRLNDNRDRIWENSEWLVDVEESGLIPEQAVFDRLVELYNMVSWDRGHSLEISITTCLYIALNENGYDYITVREIAEQVGVVRKKIHTKKKRHPESTDELRTPEEVVRIQLEDIGDVNLDDVREELLSYPDDFKYSGREPGTIAALATWGAVDWITQDHAGEIFGVTTVAIRNARDDLENRQG